MTKHLSLCFLIISLILLVGCSSDDNPAGPTIPDPIASFTHSGATTTPATINFNNSSQNTDSYYWDFGDGGSSIQENPSHLYRDYGSYTVTLIATATSTGKEDSYTRTISITPGKVFLDSITILAIPFTDQWGAGWDFASGPDLIFNLADNDGNALFNWGTFSNLSPADLPVRGYLRDPYQITNWNLTYLVNLYDEDLFDPNDFIGRTDGFSVSEVFANYGYVDSFILAGRSGSSIRVRIAVHWE